MKTPYKRISIFIAVIAILLPCCSPLILKADFDDDRVANPPNLSLPGTPSGDEIVLNVEEGCHFTVENNINFDSKVLKFTPIDTGCNNSLRLVSKNVDRSLDFMNFYFELYKESLYCPIYIYFRPESSGTNYAFRIRLTHEGKIMLNEGTERGILLGTYSANQKFFILGKIDWTTNTFNLSILRPGMESINITDRPLFSRDFWHKPRYELMITHINCYPAPSNRAYYIDNVRIGTGRDF